MKPKGPPWDADGEERAHFIYAFNMQNASATEVDEAMKKLDGYLQVVFEIYQGYVERGELHVLEEKVREGDNQRQ